MPKCTILVGVPASGKSTWQNIKWPYCKVVSTDDIIKHITHSYELTYDDGFKELIGFAEKTMWKQITKLMIRKDDFIIDRTNLTAKSRAKFIQKLKPYGYEIDCVVFPEVGSEALCYMEWHRRLYSRRGKTIPQEALDRMVDSYEIPLKSEGFDNIIFI